MLPFKKIYDYSTNNLSSEKMREVEDSIIMSGESETIYHMMMFDYVYDKEYIETLIGADDQNNRENLDSTRQKIENSTLKIRQRSKLKNQTTMKTLNGVNLPKNMDDVMTAVENLQSSITEMLESGETDCAVNAKNILMKHCSMPEAVAWEVVTDLKAGIDEFDAQVESMKPDSQGPEKDIAKFLDGKTEFEKKNLLVNSLVAFSSLQEETTTEETIRAKMHRYEAKSCDELQAEFEQAMSDDSSFENLVNIFGPSLDKPSVERLEEYRKLLNCNTAENKLYTALTLYIAQCDGKIDLAVDEKGIDARTLGACAAAAIAATHATARFQTGEIDKPTWMKWMKLIFAGLFYMSLAIMAGVLIASTGITLILGLMLLFGQGIIATFVALAITFVIVNYLVSKSLELIDWIAEALEGPYDHAVAKVVSYVGMMIAWVKERCIASEEHNEPSEEKIILEPLVEQEPETEKSDTETGYQKGSLLA